MSTPKHGIPVLRIKRKMDILIDCSQLTAWSWSPCPLWAQRTPRVGPSFAYLSAAAVRENESRGSQEGANCRCPVFISKTWQLCKSLLLLWEGISTMWEKGPEYFQNVAPSVDVKKQPTEDRVLFTPTMPFPASPARRPLPHPTPLLTEAHLSSKSKLTCHLSFGTFHDPHSDPQTGLSSSISVCSD